MGLVYSGVPAPLARALVDGLGLRVAIETGTNLGESTAALSEMVDRVWTVELSPKYVEWARDRFAGNSDDHHPRGQLGGGARRAGAEHRPARALLAGRSLVRG